MKTRRRGTSFDIQRRRPRPAILLVEDDFVLRDALALCLSRAGYAVESTSALARSVELLTRDCFDLVLTDVDLSSPSGDGYSVLAAARRLQPRTPVILFTGAAEASARLRAISQGAFAYLRKPVPLEDLLSTVARALQQGSLSTRSA